MNNQVVAKRYAGAFYAQVKESNNPAEVWEELSGLAELVKASPEFSSLVKNPLISGKEKKSVFLSLQEKGKISKTLLNFIFLLIDKNRLFLLSDINSEIKNLILGAKGECEAVAVFASEPAESDKSELVKKLSAITGKKIILKNVIDPSVIGGVRVQLGSILYDATIKGQINKLKAKLA